MKSFLIGLLAATAVPHIAYEAQAIPKKVVKVTISPNAKKILEHYGCTIKNGIMRKRGVKHKWDLAHGSGSVYVVVHPTESPVLAVGLYDRGKRYAVIQIQFFDDTDPGISPLNVPKNVVAQLFPDTY